MKRSPIRTFSLACRLVAALLLLAASGGHAAIFRVNADAPQGGDGSSWGNAYKHLQDALAVATSPDEIWVAGGIYRPDQGVSQTPGNRSASFVLKNGVKLYGRFSGSESALIERDLHAAGNETILSGDLAGDDGPAFANHADNSLRVITGSSLSNATVLNGFTITGGNANGSGATASGGALYLLSSSPTLAHCVFRANRADGSGGAIYVSGGSLSITKTVFEGNESGASGGAVFHQLGSAAISNSVFKGNLAARGGAYAQFLSSGGNSFMDHCSMQGNRATIEGGAILHVGSFSVRDTVIWENRAVDSSTSTSASISPATGFQRGRSLIQNLGSTAFSPLDGTDPANDPLFVSPLDAASAPQIGGNLQLQPGSSALSQGGDPNIFLPAGATDLAGNPRRVPLERDIGAYELQQLSYIPPGDTAVQVTVPTGSKTVIPGWALNVSTLNDGGPFSYLFTLVSNTGTLAFDEFPAADATGTLSFRPTLGTFGSATISYSLTDPAGDLLASPPLTFVITTGIARHVDASAVGAGDGSSWEDAFPHLQDALAAAVPGDAIWVAAGTYRPDLGAGLTPGDPSQAFLLPGGVPMLGGFPQGGGSFAARAIDFETHPTILSGDLAGNDGAGFTNIAENSTRVLDGTLIDGPVLLEGFIIRGGNAGSGNGGGMTFEGSAGSGMVQSRRCLFEANSATRGGGAYISGSIQPQFIDCTFRSNQATLQGGEQDPAGGAIAIIFPISGSPTIKGCLFEGNTATGAAGGAIGSYRINLNVNGSHFIHNSAKFGGAIGSDPHLSSTGGNLTNCSFSQNTATQNGGAIYYYSNDFSTNTSSIWNLNRCSFRGNAADGSGGAMYLTTRVIEFTNCELSGNSAGVSGGAYFGGFLATSRFINCTLQGNAAPEGGAIFKNQLSLVTRNTVIWGNLATGSVPAGSASIDRNAGSADFDALNCLVEHFDLTSVDPSNLDGSIPANAPSFVMPTPSAAAPTVAGDSRLLAGSPALDAGNNNWLPPEASPTDLAGNPRIVNGTVDIGAVEGSFVTFSHLGFTNPGGDDNTNGMSNFGDYASGADPTAPDDPSVRPGIDGKRPSFTYRSNAADVLVGFERSTDLLPSSWIPMTEGIDFLVSDSVTTGGRTAVTLTLLGNASDAARIFFRAVFSANP